MPNYDLNSCTYFDSLTFFPGKLRFACDQCDKKFPGRNALEAHRRTHSGEKPFVCDICGASFRTKGTLQGHQRTHTSHTPFTCNVCGRGFKRKDGLEGHMRSHEPPGTFSCDVCGNTYSRIVGLKAHKRTHSKPNPVYTCDYCGKVFTRRDNLGVHRRLHTNELSHQCSLCGKMFSHKCRLEKHQKEAHGQSEESVPSQSIVSRKKVNPSKHSTKRSKQKPPPEEVVADQPAIAPANEVEQIWHPYPAHESSAQDHVTWSHYPPPQMGYDSAFCYANAYQQAVYHQPYLYSDPSIQEGGQLVGSQENIPVPNDASHVLPHPDHYHDSAHVLPEQSSVPAEYEHNIATSMSNSIAESAYTLSATYLGSVNTSSVTGTPLHEHDQSQST